ncbi:MAG TPA: deoxyribodipyrimidine photo-lyase [Bacteroidales bacterium]|nr:deoxyribodipyrimidine photo-lyase [Bacteroidales bacterium]
MHIEERVRRLNDIEKENNGLVIYWMSRDQRIQDNWSLLFSQRLALKAKAPLIVVFCLDTTYPGATFRSYSFMLKGLAQVEAQLKALNIPFLLIQGQPENEIPEIIKKTEAKVLVTDFDPLRIKAKWKSSIAKQISIPFYEVDAHNIVPCFMASPKLEFGAYTLRPKINKLLNNYLHEFPQPEHHPFNQHSFPPVDWQHVTATLSCNRKVTEIDELIPGEEAAHSELSTFISNKLDQYATLRNDPTADATSNLSPYIHFGQISAQRVALEVLKSDSDKNSAEAFLEELIVRRELSDNFCYYNADYDNFNGLPAWAKTTLNEHRNDERQWIYSSHELESAATHDNAWNAAQKELMIRGKMHGYMRMYWAKKILEWTASPEDALSIAIYLNDKYALDGRDPNGYVGCMWAIGGVHDRAWGTRSIYGKIRYMNDNGLKRKFNIQKYIVTYNTLSANHFFNQFRSNTIKNGQKKAPGNFYS